MVKRLCKTWLDVKRELPGANRIKFMDYDSTPEMTGMKRHFRICATNGYGQKACPDEMHRCFSAITLLAGRSKLERESVCERLVEHFALEPGWAELRLAKSDKGINHFRVELVAGTAHDFFGRFIESQRFAVRPA